MIKIDVITKPEEKSESIEQMIYAIARAENVDVRVSRTNNFAICANAAVSPSQTPIIMINGHVEFAGKRLEPQLLRKRLVEIKMLMP